MFLFSSSDLGFDSWFLLVCIVKPSSLTCSTSCLGSWSPRGHCGNLLQRVGRGACQCWEGALRAAPCSLRCWLSCPHQGWSSAAQMLILRSGIRELWLTAPSPSQDRCAAARLPGSCSERALMQNDFWKQLLTVSLLSWAWRLTGRVLFFCFVPEKHQLTAPLPERSGTCCLENKQKQIFRFELVSANEKQCHQLPTHS